MAQRCKDLPDECWELIFNKLGHQSHIQDVILVSKRFLSIARHLHTTLNLTTPAVTMNPTYLSHILTQFPSIKTISLRAIENHRTVLVRHIATSSLDLESLDISYGSSDLINHCHFRLLGEKMEHLKVLKCRNMHEFTDRNLMAAAACFPRLEELNISGPHLRGSGRKLRSLNVSDFGIEMLSLKLNGLRKIDISTNPFLSDKSLMALSVNCVLLEEVVAKNCKWITADGIHILLMNCPNIKSLVISGDFERAVENLFSRASCLSTLDIVNSPVSDEFLYSLAGSGIPLKRFTLYCCRGFGCDGIMFLLQKYCSLDYLSIGGAKCLNDSSVAEWSTSLCMLTAITLKVGCLTVSTIFMVAKSCPLIEHIDMEMTEIERWDSSIDFVMNPKIKSLRLSSNWKLSDECLGGLALVCPFLETLDVSYCLVLTEKGISDFLKRCLNIRHLEINGCVRVKSIGQGSKLPNLKVLKAARSGVNNEGLAMIGKRCCELLNLDLTGCLEVTTEGLKGVDFSRLSEINLHECRNVSVNIIEWMVSSRPSLRKIIPPCLSIPLFDQMEFYLRHGCRVWTSAFNG